jgi:hypothetical protein
VGLSCGIGLGLGMCWRGVNVRVGVWAGGRDWIRGFGMCFRVFPVENLRYIEL